MVDVEPSRWEGDVVLRDGGTVHVRPIRPEDADRLVALHGRLSAESIYLRFFSARPRLSAREVAHFTTVDHVTRFALVALLGEDMVAVVRYDRWPGRNDADVALVVDDAQQRRGIATVLLELLAEAAKERGIERFTASVLPSNRRMLSLFRSVGFETGRELADGVVEVVLALDPDASGELRIEAREAEAEAASVGHLLAPRSVAVVGADDEVTSALVGSLVAGGFRGPVYPVVAGVTAIAGVPAWGSVLDLPEEVELAIVAVPAEAVEGVVRECARRRVRALLVVSPPAEDGGRALAAQARGNGMRVLGPGSLGVVATDPNVRLHAALVRPPAPGRVALAAQSAALGLALAERAAMLGVGLSTFVDTGAKADVSGNDLVQFWAGDDGTAVVLLELASFGNPRKFARIARRVAMTKPIVAVARVDDEPAAAALFAQTGVIRVDWLHELLDVARVLLGGPLPEGRRVAIVGPSGTTELAADACRASGLEVGQLQELPLAGSPQEYGAAVAAAADGGTGGGDAVLAVVPPGPNSSAVAEEVRRVAGTVGVLVVLAFRPDDAATPAPAFTLLEPAVRALGRVAAYAEWRRRPAGSEPALAVDGDAARSVLRTSIAASADGGPSVLGRTDTVALLHAYGIPVADGAEVASADEAAAVVDRLGRPVALKAGGLARRGRSEAAGVALDLQGAAEVRAAYERMQAALGESLHPALVQGMVTPGADLLVAVSPSPIFGPVLTFGAGGVAAAVAGTPARRVLPLTDADAARLLDEPAVAALLYDDAGSPVVDLEALQDLLLRVGRLASDHPEVLELRANPVIASADGAVVVDVSVRVGSPPAPPLPGGGRLR